MSHSRVKLPSCANCAYVFPADQPDDYCPRCGQLNQEINLSFGHVVEETLEGLFHFDSKFFQTLKLLLFRPGRLTQLFNTGHRVGYVPPIRLYVFISFVFFLLLSLQGGHEDGKAPKKFFGDVTVHTPVKQQDMEGADSLLRELKQDQAARKLKQAATIHPDSTNVLDMLISNRDLAWISEHYTPARTDSLVRKYGKQPTWYRRMLVSRLHRIQNASREEVQHKLQKNISLAMFLLMPLFALLLKALYVRQGRYYLSHLILSIHFHCFVFLLFTVQLLLNYLPHAFNDWVVLAVLILPAWYLYKALSLIYQQSGWKTMLKVLLMMLSYGLTLVLVLMGALTASLLLV